MKIWIFLKLRNGQRSHPTTHWVTSSSHNSTIATYGNDAHMEHLHIPEWEMTCTFLNYKNLSLAAALFSNRYLQVLPQCCVQAIADAVLHQFQQITHCFNSSHPGLYPNKQSSHWIQPKDWAICQFAASCLFCLTAQTSNFHNESFFPQIPGEVYVAAVQSQTFSARWEQLWSRSGFLTTVAQV